MRNRTRNAAWTKASYHSGNDSLLSFGDEEKKWESYNSKWGQDDYFTSGENTVYVKGEGFGSTYKVAYDDGGTNYDDFYVIEGAVPEFPTVIAGIAVVGMCTGIYWWMRRRRLES